jgi:hypothetical protein
MPPLRLAFVGQQVYFGYTALQSEAGGVVPTFVDYRFGADPQPMLAALDALKPDVVLVWRPEMMPPGVFDDVDAVVVGYLSEPLPRPGPGEPHRDLRMRLDYLRQIDPGNYDRIVSFDPMVIPTVDPFVKVWRALPIPVGDHYFGPVREPNASPRILFTGRSTDHREAFLGSVKHDFDVIHIAHGITDERLVEFLREVDVGVNLHNEPYPTFENRIPAYLAAGLLVVSEPVSPHHGLIPGTDFVEVQGPWQLYRVIEQLARHPDAFRAVRLAGRRSAERFRASTVYPRLVHDVLHDVATFGTHRTPATVIAS